MAMSVRVSEGTIIVLNVHETERASTVRRYDIEFATKFPKIIVRGITRDGYGQFVQLGIQPGVTQAYHATAADTYIYFDECDYRDWELMFTIHKFNAVAIFSLRSTALDLPRGPMAWSRHAAA